MHYFFNRYTAIAIAAQFVFVVGMWIFLFVTSPATDSLGALLFYAYLPPIFLLSVLLNMDGESGMIAAGIYGMAFGILLYGFILGFIISWFKRRRQA